MIDSCCGGTVIPAADDGELTEGDLCKKVVTHKECPHKNVTLAIEETVWRDINQIKKQMGGIEFAVLLQGSIEGTSYVVDGYYIPEQEVNATLVEIIEEVPEEIAATVIGHLHSHHHMGAFHSGTDVDHFNYPVNIVISDTGTKTTVRHRTPCGCLMEMELTKFDLSYVTEEIDLSKIKPKQYAPLYPTGGYNQQQYKNYPRRYGEIVPVNQRDTGFDALESGEKKKNAISHITRIGKVGDVIDYRKNKNQQHINKRETKDDLEDWREAFTPEEWDEYDEYLRIKKGKAAKLTKDAFNDDEWIEYTEYNVNKKGKLSKLNKAGME